MKVPAEVNDYESNSFAWETLSVYSQTTKDVTNNLVVLEDLARYFYLNNSDETARKILTSYINYIHGIYSTNTTSVIDEVEPDSPNTHTNRNPYIAALEGLICLFSNLGGIELGKTYFLLTNRFNYLEDCYTTSGNMIGTWTNFQPNFSHGGTTYKENYSYWQAKIIEFYSECLIHRDAVRDELGNFALSFPNLEIAGNKIAHFIDEIKEADFPKLEQTYSAGNKQTISLNTNPVGKNIRFRYVNLPWERVIQIIDFYNTIQQEADGKFNFPTALVDYDDFDGFWVFTEAPKFITKIGNANKAVFDVSVSVRRIDN